MPSFPIRPNILKMAPYSAGKPIDEVRRELGLDRVIKLASNENPLGPSPLAIQAVEEAARSMHIYPDSAIVDLRQALSDHYRFPADQIVVGNGSDELLHLLGLVLLGSPSDNIVVGDPSFARYDAAAGVAGCELIKVKVDAEMRLNLAEIASAVNADTKIIFIANPNNPTGTVVTTTEVEALIARIPDHVVVVLDEAYFEFAHEAADFPNSMELVHRFPNLVGMRTFSKAFGLAGVRVGFMCAPAPLADAIHRAREPFNVNALAQVAAIAALRDQDHVRQTVELNTRGLRTLERVFRAVGARPFMSHANFMMADLGIPARPVFQRLLERGVITRPGDVLGLPNCLRVSVGTDAEMTIFEQEFTAIMSLVTA